MNATILQGLMQQMALLAKSIYREYVDYYGLHLTYSYPVNIEVRKGYISDSNDVLLRNL